MAKKKEAPRTIFDNWADEGQAARAQRVSRAESTMIDVLTLIHACIDMNEGGGVSDPFTSPDSRLTAVLLMAKNKAVEALADLEVTNG